MTVLEQSKARAQIVAALDGLTWDDRDGTEHTIRARPTQPPTAQPLDCWPQWDHTTWLNAHGAQATTWNVLVVLPQKLPADWGLEDRVASLVGLALRRLGPIDRAEPVGVALAGAAGPTVPAVSITVTI